MILAVAGTDAALKREVVGFLAARSAEALDVASLGSPEERGARLATLSDARHHVLTGVRAVEELRVLHERADLRVVFVGPPPGAGTPLGALLAACHLHLETADEEAFARLTELVREAMTALPRPGWDAYFMDIAHVVARRSNCLKRKVAAVVVRDKRIITTGYNGTPRGARNCNEGGCPRCGDIAPSGTSLDDCLCCHAEENAIVQAAFHGIRVRDATLYCTLSPCLHCTKLIVNAGIAEVVYNADYPLGQRSLALLAECRVLARRFPVVTPDAAP